MVRVYPLEHTADVGFRVEGDTLEEVFLGAMEGLLGVIFQTPPKGGRRRRLLLEAEDLESLLVRWLNELIYLVQTKGFVPGKARLKVEKTEEGWRLKASLQGEDFKEAFGFQGEVKSATYHGLQVREEGGRWRAQVILDV